MNIEKVKIKSELNFTDNQIEEALDEII